MSYCEGVLCPKQPLSLSRRLLRPCGARNDRGGRARNDRGGGARNDMVDSQHIVTVAHEFGFVPDLDQLVFKLADKIDHFVSDRF